MLVARPGGRLWEVDTSGSVYSTHQFGSLPSLPRLPLFSYRFSPLVSPSLPGSHGAGLVRRELSEAEMEGSLGTGPPVAFHRLHRIKLPAHIPACPVPSRSMVGFAAGSLC